ncbi:hypothetical protein [Anaerotruncus rubiinfantis]|uniref:hypothetical protein n=1 Tax=Anaerotruncus rubiinfantis TaxID=1720200 RepID=UPI00189B19CF|nr:hypothetical protein [Anaerotruncus rubiinfantis]
MDALPQSVVDIINAAVTKAVQKAVKETTAALKAEEPAAPAPERDYFKIMEKLLYSYPTLKRIVSDKAAYTSVELRERSKSLVQFRPNTQWKSRDDIIDEMERDKEAEYDKTLKDFRRIERVIQEFKDRKEFAVVRLYYFKENIDGTPKAEGEQEITWEDVSFALEREIKTLRRWRSNIVNDMALCLFGIDAAIQAGTLHNT